MNKLTAADGFTADGFGLSVAASGDTVVVGAPDTVGSSIFDGGVYIFQRDHGGPDSWGQVAKRSGLDDRPGQSVAISGDTVVLGDTVALNSKGAAFIYQRNHGGTDNWGLVATLTASDAQMHDAFGFASGISGDIAVVGAFREDTGGDDSGAAYIFYRDQGGTDNWGQLKRLKGTGIGAGDSFGYNVAVSGDTVMVRARYGGFVHVFERNSGGADNWGEVKRIPSVSGDSGFALSADTAILGMHHVFAPGAAAIHERDQGGKDNWGLVTTLTPSVANAIDDFGYSVGLDGDIAIVGASWSRAEPDRPGAAFVFHRDEGGADNWGEVNVLTSPDAIDNDWFGRSVAVNGGIAVVGAPFETWWGDPGNAYVFEPKFGTPLPPTATPTSTSTPDLTDTDGDGCPDQRENGSDEMLGGMRDWQNPNDFYDVLGGGGGPPDGVIDLPNDVLGVIQHFSPAGAPPYDVQFDRGPSSGPHPWNMTAPDGVIDLPNDILGVITQFDHDCR